MRSCAGRRLLEVPVWMFDRASCHAMQPAPGPRVDFAALVALRAGLIRCRRCGRKLTVRYSGAKHDLPRYACHRGQLDHGEARCIAFGGLRVDDAIEEALLAVVQPGAVAAALEAEAHAASRHD